MSRAALLGLVLLGAVGCKKTVPPGGELSRAECMNLSTKKDRIKSGELGRTNDAARRKDVDRCVEHGTKRWKSCIEFASTPREIDSCDAELK